MSNTVDDNGVRVRMRRVPEGPVGGNLIDPSIYNNTLDKARKVIQQGRQKIDDSNTVDHEFSETINRLEDSIPQKEHSDLKMDEVSKLLNALRLAKSALSRQ